MQVKTNLKAGQITLTAAATEVTVYRKCGFSPNRIRGEEE